MRKERHCTGNLKGEMFKGARYIPAWGKNSGYGNRKTSGKNSVMVGNLPQGKRKRRPGHGTFVQCRWEVEKDLKKGEVLCGMGRDKQVEWQQWEE